MYVKLLRSHREFADNNKTAKANWFSWSTGNHIPLTCTMEMKQNEWKETKKPRLIEMQSNTKLGTTVRETTVNATMFSSQLKSFKYISRRLSHLCGVPLQNVHHWRQQHASVYRLTPSNISNTQCKHMGMRLVFRCIFLLFEWPHPTINHSLVKPKYYVVVISPAHF